MGTSPSKPVERESTPPEPFQQDICQEEIVEKRPESREESPIPAAPTKRRFSIYKPPPKTIKEQESVATLESPVDTKNVDKEPVKRKPSKKPVATNKVNPTTEKPKELPIKAHVAPKEVKQVEKTAAPAPQQSKNTRSSPARKDSNHSDKVQQIRYLRQPNGKELCIFRDDQGKNWFCNWNYQRLEELPLDIQESGIFFDPNSSLPIAKSTVNDPLAFQKFVNSKGKPVVVTTIPIQRQVRVYFDENTSQWMHMSLAQEMEIPVIANMVRLVQQSIPSWRNPYDVLEGLRNGGYDIGVTLEAYRKRRIVEDKYLDNVAQQFFNSTDETQKLEDSFNSIYKQLTNGNLKGELPAHEAKGLIVQLFNELETTFDSMTRASSKCDSLGKDNEALEKKIAALKKTIREHVSIQKEKEETLTRLNHSLCDITEKNQELLSTIELLENGTDTDMRQFQSGLLSEKETHLQRMRAQISNYQIKLKEANASKTSHQEALRELAQRLSRIKMEYDHLKNGISRRFDELRMHIRIKCISPIREGLSTVQHHQNALIEELRLRQLSDRTRQNQFVGRSVRILARIKRMVGMLIVLASVIVGVPNGGTNVLSVLSKTDLAINTNASPTQFRFDRIFDEKANQKTVYSEISGSVPLVLKGYNLGIFAVGQHGCGKSYTMHGAIANEGVIFLALNDLYNHIQRLESKGRGTNVEVTLSAFDICNERVYDLFSDDLAVPSKFDGSYLTGGEKLDPPARLVKCANLQSAMGAINRANSSRKQSSTLRKMSTADSNYIIRISVRANEVVANKSIEANIGSICFVDAGAIPIDLSSKKHGVNPMSSIAIGHTYATLEYCLKSKYHEKPITRQSSSSLQTLVSNCFSADSLNFVILGLSSFEKDSKSTIRTLEFGKSVVSL